MADSRCPANQHRAHDGKLNARLPRAQGSKSKSCSLPPSLPPGSAHPKLGLSMPAFDVLMTGSRAAAKEKVAATMKRKALNDDSSSVGHVTDCIGMSKKTMMMKVDSECGIEQIRSKTALLNSAYDDFDPKSAVCWGVDDKVPFLFLCHTYDMIFGESKTNVNIRIANNMVLTLIKCAAPPDLLAVLCLSAYQISAPHEGSAKST